MTMIQVFTGIDPITKKPTYGYAHPFLVGAQRRETRIPDKHITKKTRREVAAWRVIPREATIPARKEKYNRANR